MADAQSARQQVVDKVKESSNILVTLSQDPSVDELSAALGLTIMLNKLGKHATAVMSGEIPPAVAFLDPEKTFENTVDSLRDFIIALDKEKADHLRYKVDGDVVKIFITPYRTTISEQDLDFSQGDYNVELVLALGVKDESHLDKALEAHGRILHDATVVTIGTDSEASNLGSIDWHDETASSISEMLVSISEALKADKPLLDEQTSTALLTGIVAATDRFSNERTSSKVMTMAAQLMAAGANQQLIASKLEEAHEIGGAAPANADGTTDLSEDTSTKLDKSKKASKKKKDDTATDAAGVLAVPHAYEGTLDEIAEQVHSENTDEAAKEASEALDAAAHDTAPASDGDQAAKAAEDKLAEELKVVAPSAAEPVLGGTLNATTELAAEDKRREEESSQNRTILSHGETGHVTQATPPTVPQFNANSPDTTSDEPMVDPLSQSAPLTPTAVGALADEPAQPTPAPQPQASSSSQTLADLDAQVRQPENEHDDARAAVHAAYALDDTPTPPSEPAAAPAVDTTGLPPLPDFSTLPPPPSPGVPPLPSTQPSGAVPAEQLENVFNTPSAPVTPPASPATPPANDPGQFKIPGQS